MAEITRRNLFQIVGTAPALAALAPAQSPAPPAAYQRRIFDDHQWRTAGVLCDLIIPADDRSGSATEAGVPEFIDDWLDFRKQEDDNDNLAAEILGGLAWLDRESLRLNGKYFADAAPEQQTRLLDRIAWPERAAAEDHHAVVFFNKFRDLTASGFFSSKMGVADLPYLGNVAVEEWKGCDPAAWARIEERMKNGYKGLGGEVKPW
jgi:Gluconate 2-dehydrogenase subunit 3